MEGAGTSSNEPYHVIWAIKGPQKKKREKKGKRKQCYLDRSCVGRGSREIPKNNFRQEHPRLSKGTERG